MSDYLVRIGKYIRHGQAEVTMSSSLLMSATSLVLKPLSLRDISAESQEHTFATLTELLEYLSAELMHKRQVGNPS